jgi:hypothetical protein
MGQLVELNAGVEADSAWSLQILRVERCSTTSGPDSRRRPTSGDDPFLLSSGLAGFLGALTELGAMDPPPRSAPLATVKAVLRASHRSRTRGLRLPSEALVVVRPCSLRATSVNHTDVV